MKDNICITALVMNCGGTSDYYESETQLSENGKAEYDGKTYRLKIYKDYNELWLTSCSRGGENAYCGGKNVKLITKNVIITPGLSLKS